MTIAILAKVEDRPTPKSVYNWRVYACACVAGSAAIMIGYDSAFIGTTIALPSFRSEFKFDSLSKSSVNLLSANIVSCYQAGALLGAISAYAAGFYGGRKFGMALYAIIFMLGAGLMCGANGQRGLGLIYAGRVLAGVGMLKSSFPVPAQYVNVYRCRWCFWSFTNLHIGNIAPSYSRKTCMHVRTRMANRRIGRFLD